MINYSVVIPVYRGTESVVRMAQLIKEFFDERKESCELICVFDCGKTESWTTLLALKETYGDWITIVKLSRNYGQHNATICGFECAKGDFIITMDEDLQHHPQDIVLLIESQKLNNCDVVYGNYSDRKHSFFRNLTSSLMKRLLQKGIPELHPDYSSFRLLKSSIAKLTCTMNNSYTFLDGYLVWITIHVTSVEVRHGESYYAESSYSIKKLIEHSINIFVTFSNLPIRILVYSSLAFFGVSFLYAAYTIGRYFIAHDIIKGFSTLAVFLGFGFGFVLLGFGIIGEYIQRINLKTTKRPNYIVSEKI